MGCAPLTCAGIELAGERAAKFLFLSAGHDAQDTCVYGLGDLPGLIQSPALFANFEPSSTDPLVVACLERQHRLKALRQAEVPTEPHWQFPRETSLSSEPHH